MTDAACNCAWNICPKCGQLVDTEDCFDGSEVRCLACNILLVCTAFTDETWALVSADDTDDPTDDTAS